MAVISKILALFVAGASLASVVAEEPAAVDPAFGTNGEVQEVVHQQASLRGVVETLPQGGVEAQAAVEADNAACHAGLVGQVYHQAPTCFDACPQACGPLGQAITAYMTKGGQPAAKKVVCQNKGAFGCALTSGNLPKCRPLITKAASFGFKLPSSMGELNSQCR